MLPLKRLEKTLEIPSSKPIKRVPLDDLYKYRWPVPDMLGEDLKQVSALVKIHQDIQPLEHVYVRPKCPRNLCEALSQIGIVCGRDTEELDTACLEVSHGGDDVVRAERNVLDSGAVVVVDKPGNVSSLVHEIERNRREKSKHVGKKGYSWAAYSSICDFFLPVAGSFMGILIVSFGEAMTMDRIAEYSLHMALSSTVQ